jgi:hypothetical protein
MKRMQFKFGQHQEAAPEARLRYAGRKAGTDSRGSWGGAADLYSMLLAVALEPLPPVGETLEQIRREIRSNDPYQVSKLVVFLGEQRYFRELSLFLSAELIAIHNKSEDASRHLAFLDMKPEELPAWLEYYRRAGRKRPRRMLRKRLAGSFLNLDEYRFSRYAKDVQLKIKYAVAILKPVPVDSSQQELFLKIRGGRIPVRPDWKTEWQRIERQYFDSVEIRQAALRDKWKEGVSTFRIGYTTMVENLVPILTAGVSGKVLRLAAEYLRHPAAIARSGITPVRLLQAYRNLRRSEHGGARMLLEAIETAVENSAVHMGGPGKGELVVVGLDVSNSMLRSLNQGGRRPEYPDLPGEHVELFDLGFLVAMLLKIRGCQVEGGIIGNNWKKIQLPSGPIFHALDDFRARAGEAGYAVNAHLILESLIRKGQMVDRVMIFSDYRLWEHRPFNQDAGADLGSLWRDYRRLAPGAELILFDLAGTGRPIEWLGDGVVQVSGWDDRVFHVLDACRSLPAFLAPT